MNDFPREILPWYRLILFEQTPQLHKYLSSYSWKEIIFPFYLRLKCLDHIFFLSPQQAYTATARLHVILKWFWLQSLNDCGLWETHIFFFYLRQILGIQNSSLQLRRNIYYKKNWIFARSLHKPPNLTSTVNISYLYFRSELESNITGIQTCTDSMC